MGPRKIYGLGVASDAPVAALAALPPADRLDVRWHFGPDAPVPAGIPERDWQERHRVDETGVRAAAAPAHSLRRLAYDDGTVFILEEDGSEVWATTPAGATIEDTATYLLGPVMGFVLRLRGITCLHACAVAVGGRAVVFAGHAGSGKSTLAAAFARRRHAVLTEDVTAIVPGESGFGVEPSYPLVRLWPESAAALFGSPESLPLITPNWDKRYLGLGEGGYPFESRRLPLAAVYVLSGRGPGDAAIEEAAPAAALMDLVERAYSANLLDRDMRAREFELLSRLVEGVPVFRVALPDGMHRLDRFCDAIASRHDHASV